MMVGPRLQRHKAVPLCPAGAIQVHLNKCIVIVGGIEHEPSVTGVRIVSK